MTLQRENCAPGAAVIDGVDVDAVAAAVAGCAGVAALDGGRFGEVVSYLPGRTVAGVVVGNGRVTVQVRARWGIPVPDLAALITVVLAPLTGHRPVDVVIADIDDPPVVPPVSGPPVGPPVSGPPVVPPVSGPPVVPPVSGPAGTGWHQPDPGLPPV